MSRLEPATYNNVSGRHQDGQSQAEVARQFNAHKSTISRHWQILNQARSDRPCITTPAQDRYTRVFHLRNRAVTATTRGLPKQSVAGFSNSEYGQEALMLDQL